MRNYDGIFMLNAALSEEAIEKEVSQIQDLIKKLNGMVRVVDKWGKKRLSHAIKKHTEAVYYLINFDIEQKGISVVEKTLKLNENVLRTFIVKVK